MIDAWSNPTTQDIRADLEAFIKDAMSDTGAVWGREPLPTLQEVEARLSDCGANHLKYFRYHNQNGELKGFLYQ